jgi:hypothetical protein
MTINEREHLFHSKYLHQLEQVDSLNRVNALLLFTYYVFIIIVLYFLFTKYDYSIYTKGIFSVIAISYPFIVNFIENSIYNVIHYMGAFIGGIPPDEKQKI